MASPADIPTFIGDSRGRPIGDDRRSGRSQGRAHADGAQARQRGTGSGSSSDRVGLGPVEAVGRAFEFTWLVTKEIGKSLARLAIGEGREDVSSPIGITQVSSEAVEQGTDNYLWVLALVSLSLALLNLLPLLPLDGGHILFALLEGARGRFLRREIYERVSVVGLAVVLLLFFIGVTNDVGRLTG